MPDELNLRRYCFRTYIIGTCIRTADACEHDYRTTDNLQLVKNALLRCYINDKCLATIPIYTSIFFCYGRLECERVSAENDAFLEPPRRETTKRQENSFIMLNFRAIITNF